MFGGYNVGLRHYVDELHRILEREIDTRAALIEAEIDRRANAIQREAEQAAADLNQRLAVMNEFRAATRGDLETVSARIDKIEKTLDTQRGRQYAYAAIAGILGVLLTIAILIAGHISVK